MNLLQRVLTALVGIPVLLAAIWWGSPWLTVLLALVVVLGIREFYRLFNSTNTRLPVALGILWCLGFILGAEATSDPVGFLTTSLIIFMIGAFAASLWVIAYYRDQHIRTALVYLLLGPVYVGFLVSHAIVLRGISDAGDLGRNWLLFALLVTFATDTGAYLTGRSIGRHKLAPAISPSKTWEGAAGGFMLAIVAALVLGFLLELALPRWQQAVIGATVGMVSQVGDLAESKLKRVSQVKDTGSIIPGHGGILDRLDSLVFAVPAVYYLISLVFKP